MKYLTNFNTLLEYKDALILDIPNVSYIIEDKIVKYTEEPIITNKYILYTSTNSEVINPKYSDVFGALLISNEYDNFGLISFDAPVTSIGDGTFYNCQALTYAIIPDSVTRIGNEAFERCSSLTFITIPASVESIGGYAFAYCSALTSVVIGSSVESIGMEAFNGCSSLTSIVIPDSVTSIGNGAFYGCSSLNKTNYTGDIAGWCTIEFDYGSNPISKSHNLYINDQEIRDLVIPNTVNTICNYTFYSCRSLISVIIPNSVTSIGDYAFYDCSSLTSVTIGNSVTSIGNEAFSTCQSLTSITIPSNVIRIGWRTFKYCNSLTSITCEATTPPTLDLGNDLSNVTAVYVPAESVDAYRTATNWSYYADKIQPIQ